MAHDRRLIAKRNKLEVLLTWWARSRGIINISQCIKLEITIRQGHSARRKFQPEIRSWTLTETDWALIMSHYYRPVDRAILKECQERGNTALTPWFVYRRLESINAFFIEHGIPYRMKTLTTGTSWPSETKIQVVCVEEPALVEKP